MKIVDSQIHIWLPPNTNRQWNSGEAYQSPISYEKILDQMDRAGVDAAILVPPSFEGNRNDYAIKAAVQHPKRFAVMGRISLTDINSPQKLKNWKKQFNMLGVRLTYHLDKFRDSLTDGSSDWFWPQADELNIPVMVHAPEKLDELLRVSIAHPNLKIIIDHMGFARSTIDDKATEAVNRLVKLSIRKNIFVKISAIPCYSTQNYPYKNLHFQIKRVVDAFGPSRCFWGTDFTRLPLSSSYIENVTLFTQELDFLNKSDIELIMGGALMNCLNWDI